MKGAYQLLHNLGCGALYRIVEEFAKACENAEMTQAKELSKFMARYIKKHHPDYE